MQYKLLLTRVSEKFSQLTNRLCLIKNEDELVAIRTAAKIADDIYAQVIPEIRPGVSELYIKGLFDKLVVESTADKLAFDTIIASGPNGAFPHAIPCDRLILPDDLVVVDFGVMYKNFNSDMTRTLLMNPLNKQAKSLYKLVLDAQQGALSLVRSGVEIKLLDDQVRETFKKYGFADYFIHGLGHGVGHKIHEAPSINQKSTGVLKKNMVITIEPGIYLPGFGGVRIEDTIIVRDDGFELLTHSPKNIYL